jgi:hypothetical protein
MAYAAGRLGIEQLPLQLVKGFNNDAPAKSYWIERMKMEIKGDACFEAFVAINHPCRKASSYSVAVSNLNLFRGISKSGFLGPLRLTDRSSSNAREAIKAVGDSADGSSS